MPPEPQPKSADSPQALVPESDKAGPKPTFDSEVYNKVARSAKLRRIALVRSKFFVIPQYFIEEEQAKSPKLEYQAQMHNPNFDADRGTASCEWHWVIASKSKRKVTLTAEAIYVIVYSGLKECDSEAVTAYMRRVGRFATYPYFRARVSQLSWESGTNLPVLPSIAT